MLFLSCKLVFIIVNYKNYNYEHRLTTILSTTTTKNTIIILSTMKGDKVKTILNIMMKRSIIRKANITTKMNTIKNSPLLAF